MKIKHLLATAVALLCTASSWAQTDVTSTYLTADFSSSTGWTLTSGGGSEHSEGFGLIGTLNLNSKPSTTDASHLSTEYCCGFSARWNGRYTYYQQTTKSLPAGYWAVKYDVQDVNTTSTKYNMDNHFYVQVGETKYTDASTEWMNAGASSWTAHSISFTLTEASTVTLSFGYGNKENKGSSDCPAIYVSHLKLEYIPFATPEDYTNLNSAISTVEGKAWGFDEGELAPYNYVEVLEALATAKAINQEANNSQVTVQNLTSTLNGADWSSTNATEVNAFYDGNFSAAASVSTNTCPTGWHGSDSHYTEGYWVRLMYSNGSSNTGLQHFANSCAMMAKSTPRYGLDPGYTMPLNADTYYKLSFDFAGWGGGNSGLKTTIVVTDGADGAISVTPAQTEGQNENGQSNQEAWKTYTGYFKTGDAGNYKLLLNKTEGDGSAYQITYGDMVLKTLTVAEATAYYNAVKDEVDDSYNAGANGGSEKTAFKAAIDASVPATIDEIMEAAAALYTLRDAFVAATPKYNALEAEKTSAIALGVSSDDANAVTMTSASQLQEKLQALYVLEDAAVTAGYAVDATTMFGSWTPQNLSTKSDEHWSGTTITYYDKWSSSGFTGSITSTVTLPACKYVFKLAARAQTGAINGAFNLSVKVGDNAAVYKDFVAKDNTGKGITTSGAVSYSDGTFCNSGNGRGWEWRFIGFELDAEASVTMTGYAQIYGGYWVGFSDATLLTTSDNVAVLKDLLNTEITTATSIDKTTNVGSGVFQTPSSAVTALNGAIDDAQTVYDDGDATSDEVSDAISDLQTAETTYNNTVNAPADGKKYYIKVATSGHAKENKAWLLAAGTTGENNPTGYTIAANENPAVYFAQAFTFTQVSGNTYNISITLPEGEVYLTYGSLNGSAAAWRNQQIQATTNSANKGEFKIYAGNTANTFKIFNTVDNNYIDCQDGGNIYTDTGITKELFAVAEASEASVSVNLTAGKYGTRIFPFTPTLPSEVKAYSCAAVDGSTLTLVEEDSPAANTPYIIYSEDGYTGDALTGWGTATAASYKPDGSLLTGIYNTPTISAGENNYVLQTKDNGEQAFCIVEEDFTNTAAYRAYLTVPAAGVKAFYFGFDEDAINSLSPNPSPVSEGSIYNLAGQRMSKMQKGVNIVNGKKVLVK